MWIDKQKNLNQKHQKARIFSAFFIFIFGFLLFSLIIPPTSARQEPVSGFQYQGEQTPQEGKVEYQFSNNLNFGLEANANVSLDINFDNSLKNRYLGMHVSNQNPISLQIGGRNQNEHVPNGEMGYYKNRQEDRPGNSPTSEGVYLTSTSDVHKIGYSYDTFYSIFITGSYESIELYSPINADWGLKESELSWAIYDTTTEEWYLLESTVADEQLSTTLNSEDIEGTQLLLTIVYFNENIGNFWSSPVGIALIVGIVIIAVLGLMMTKTEYREYLLNRFMYIDPGAHRLSMEQVLENENRTQIINEIIDSPGIHFNELLRRIDITAGTLAWHLDILETFRVIRKQRVGQYLLYYPYLDKNPISRIDPKLQKSRTTLEILQLIDDHPGVYQNQIAKRMDLDHKTVKYHLDKLLEAEIVYTQKKGRQTMFFPKEVAQEVLDDDLTYAKD